ncbi:MAG: NUDIX domain-containing protein [Hyphomicrobiales bacterium]
MSTIKLPDNFSRRVPDGDNLVRDVCETCGFISYANPKLVVGSVVSAENDRILLCKRAIEPRAGFWTLPAGYLELNETPDAGAAREAMEEANAKIAIDCLLAVYAIPRISQVQMIFRAKLDGPDFSPGPESEEVGLFTWDEIPWGDIAFPSVHWALGHFREASDLTGFPPFTNPEGVTGDRMIQGM